MTIDKQKLKTWSEKGLLVPNAPAAILALLAEIEGLHTQHGRDSAALRRLCQARDDLKRKLRHLQGELDSVLKNYRSLSASAVSLNSAATSAGDEISRLKAENEALRDGANFRAIQSLRADCEALLKDAERYRWLRDQCGLVEYKAIAGSIGPGMLPCGEELQEAIDAAMAKEANHG